jgi:DNA-binding transcriptional ArsR family regulator
MHMRSASQTARRAKTDVLTDAQVLIASGTFQVLADPTRLRIVHELLSGPRSVGAMATACGVSASAISHQLQRLRDLRLVSYTRRGTTLFYELIDEHVGSFCREALYHADHVVTGKGHR